MAKSRAGLIAAGGVGLALLSACKGPNFFPSDALSPEEEEYRISVTGYHGFEAQAVNKWQASHSGERLTRLEAVVKDSKFIGYTAITQKGESGVDVVCQNLPVGATANELPPMEIWRQKNEQRAPADRRTELFFASVPNADYTVGEGYIVCTLPFQQ